MSVKKLYRQVSSYKLDEGLYMKHLSAMTSEDLHSKADIATELAYRDQMISNLKGIIDTLIKDWVVPDSIKECIKATELNELLASYQLNIFTDK